MRLALFPAPGGGLGALYRSGQLSRQTDYYLPAYSEAFDEVLYFSYLRESFAEYGVRFPRDNVRLIANDRALPRRLYTFALPWLHGTRLRDCSISRVFDAPGVIPAWCAKLRWRIPMVVTYDYPYAEFARVEGRYAAAGYNVALEQLAFRTADAIIVTTEELARYVARYAPESRIHLIPSASGIDVRLFRPDASARGASVPVVLFVGRLVPQKDLFTLLEAVAGIKDRTPLSLELVGAGPLRDGLAQRSAELGIDVAFRGTIPNEQLPAVYQGADVFVLPSLIEGHPKALLEAMACGLPVIASDAPGNRVVVQDGVNGLLVPTGDAHALGEAICRVLNDPDLAHRLGQAARATIAARHDLRSLLAQEVALLQETARAAGRG